MEALKKNVHLMEASKKKGSPDGSCGGGGVSVGTSSHLDQAVLVAAPANLNVKTKSVKKNTHFQMPVASLFILSLPQKVQVYFECCEISIFFTVFLREAPYLVSQ